ncbi:lipopolysaccharide biosynthesis protein [Paenibacillus thermoaerophilus]|uniref:Lipopolysaccharide biosynthesis protein n=1 Tax=Paenibacillus thermoaerophilus TaxID=1215385 RepID=A0ABW2V7U6_9BACL|nr:oligosaccharide flippase family protein [Paenibacillus thermoaerophilus]TMV16156.1 hypothetical protein FE781_08810 [Paenibacillus thermoaerophilus]
MIAVIRRTFGGKSLAGTIARTGAANFTILLVTTLTSLLTARLLGVVGKGELAAVLMWPTLIAGLIGFGIPTSFIYHVKRRHMDRPGIAGLLRVALAVQLAASLLAGLAAWFGMPYGLSEYRELVIRMAQWYTLFSILLTLGTGMLLALAQSVERFEIYNRLRLLIPALNLIGLAVQLPFGPLTLAGTTAAYGLTGALACGWGAVKLKEYFSATASAGMPLRPFFGYGLRVYGIELLGTLSSQIDKLMIVALLAPRDFGLYTVVYSLSRVFNVVQNAVANVIFPKAAGMEADKIVESVTRVFRISLAVMTAALLPGVIVGRFLLGLLFGQAFLEADVTFYLLSAECVVGGSSWVLASSFNALGRPGLVISRQSIAMVATIGLMFALIPLWGLEGLALALLAGAALRLLLSLAAFPICFGVPLRRVLYNREDAVHAVRLWRRLAYKKKGAGL